MPKQVDGTISAKDIADRLGRAKKNILRRANNEKWPFDNGKNRTRQYKVAGLPEDIRIALGVGPVKTVVNTNSNAVTKFVGSPDLAGWQNKKALARVDLVREYTRIKKEARKRKQSKVKAARLWLRGYNTGQVMPQVFKVLGRVSRSTIELWCKRLREGSYNFTALAPQHGNRAGKRKVTKQEMETALAFALHPNRLRVSEVLAWAKKTLAKKGIESPSSEATLRRAILDFKNNHYDQWIFCRQGEKAHNDKCLPYIDRDARLLNVGDVLVADGHRLNFQVLHPFTGKPCRANMITWFDWASRMPCGFEIMPTENTQAIAAALRRAIISLGKMPKVAYLDNGKAFKARFFTDTEIDFEEAGFYGLFGRLGIQPVFAWPYHGQSKPVERFFETFGRLERLLPTYVGTDIAHKPAHMLRNEKLHKKIHLKKYGGWVPTIEEAVRIIEWWVQDYANTPHRGLKGLCPQDVFDAGRGPGVEKRALTHLMMHREIKAVGRNGVNLLGWWYYDEALYGMRGPVLVKYDFCDMSSVLVYDKTGAHLICEALPRMKLHPMARLAGPDDMALLQEGIRQKRRLKKATEEVARGYVREAPQLIEAGPTFGVGNNIDSTAKTAQGTGRRVHPASPKGYAVTRGEAERIEAEASKMRVVALRPKNRFYATEVDRFEDLLVRELQGEELPMDDLKFMQYFKTTEIYRRPDMKSRFDFLAEQVLGEQLTIDNDQFNR